MRRFRITKEKKFDDMSEIDRVKAELNKHEFLAKYIESVIRKKDSKGEIDDDEIYRLYGLMNKEERKADEILKKYLKLDALRYSYSLNENKNIFNIAELMEKIYDFFEENTKFSRDYIIDFINKNLLTVEVEKEYEDNPNGIGGFDSIFKELSVKESQINNDGLEKLLRHEFTHLFGSYENKKGHISGYSTEPPIDVENTEITKYSNNPIKNFIKKIFNGRFFPKKEYTIQ